MRGSTWGVSLKELRLAYIPRQAVPSSSIAHWHGLPLAEDKAAREEKNTPCSFYAQSSGGPWSSSPAPFARWWGQPLTLSCTFSQYNNYSLQQLLERRLDNALLRIVSSPVHPHIMDLRPDTHTKQAPTTCPR